MLPAHTVALCRETLQHIAAQQGWSVVLCCWSKMAVDAWKHLQMSLFSCEMCLWLTSSRCRHLDLVERNQGVTQSQYIYIYFYICRCFPHPKSCKITELFGKVPEFCNNIISENLFKISRPKTLEWACNFHSKCCRFISINIIFQTWPIIIHNSF